MSDQNDESPIVSLDMAQLEAVTGGSGHPIGGSTNNIDVLLKQLNEITGSIKDVSNKTKGLGQTEMLMLCALAMRNNQRTNNVVVVAGGAPRKGWCW